MELFPFILFTFVFQDSDSDASDHSRSASPETTTPGLGSIARKRRTRFAPKDSSLDGQDLEGARPDEVEEEEEEEKHPRRRIPSPEPAKTEEEKMHEMVLIYFRILY